jgi:hypothetical protein
MQYDIKQMESGNMQYLFNPNPHCFKEPWPSSLLRAEKSHYYPTSFTSLWGVVGGAGEGVLSLQA